MDDAERGLDDIRRRLEHAACGLVETDGSGRITWCNATFCSWVGRKPADLVDRLAVQDLFTMGGRIFHQTHWAPLLQMQGSVSEVKLEVVHADGHTIPMVMNAIRREAGRGMVHDLAFYVARDRDKYERELVLSRKRLEEAVAQSARLEAEAKDRALLAEQMIGIVSHDLRNPLSSIHMGVLLLSRTGATPKQLAVLDRMKRAGDRANRLISELLDFTQARLGTGISIHPQTIDLHQVVKEHVDELTLAFPGRVIRHEGGGEAAMVVADPDRLAQLLGNLVANAVAYGDPQASITVSTAKTPEAGVLRVHNDGTPIPADVLPRIFLPLSRGVTDSSASRSVGLGLYIVSEIARAHGGNVAVDSAAQRGTTFTVAIPAAD